MPNRIKTDEFDCIVIGGGHAGAEAAHAAAKMGAKTCLVTLSKDTIAKMSCNPAIGGLAKGQIAREVDALGGLMGLSADATGIQFRLLNRSKGPAVRSPRAQTDKYKYKDFIRSRLEQTENLTIIEAMACEVLAQDNRVCGIRCADGTLYYAPTVVVTTGTFLRGLMHIGSEQFPGGRLGEPAANGLSESLIQLGLELRRLKTGTPARLDAKTVDFDKCEIQLGDEDPMPFSFMTERLDRPQIPCWITYTNEQIHRLIRDNLHRAPLYTGQITSVGPRYCPSIETKIVRFADKIRHQVFLEPEDEQISTIYCNGISTSLPKDVQEQMLRLTVGTENARIIHFGYAIEYDFCPPTQLYNSLETRKIQGLFLAGQINGTSGYEEAAGQGIIAGINAARKLQGKEPIVLGRDQAYIGVMIDDLLTRGIDEPYRMFTSRAEYRLTLRADNADRRLTPTGIEVALVDKARQKKFENKVQKIEELKTFLKTPNKRDVIASPPKPKAKASVAISDLTGHQIQSTGRSMWDGLRRPDNNLNLADNPHVKAMGYPKDVLEAVIIDAKYEGYLAKQDRMVAGLRTLDNKKLPIDLDYKSVAHLRFEAVEKLSTFRPATLGQAARISGITPADITVLQVHLKKSSK